MVSAWLSVTSHEAENESCFEGTCPPQVQIWAANREDLIAEANRRIGALGARNEFPPQAWVAADPCYEVELGGHVIAQLYPCDPESGVNLRNRSALREPCGE